MKNDFCKKTIAVICVLTLLAGILAGCGGNGGNTDGGNGAVDNTVEDTKNLKIMLYAKGYGTEWMTAAAEAFEAKNEGVSVDVTLVNSREVMQADIKNSANSDIDLYFDIASSGGQSLVEEYKQSYNSSQAMRELTYLYNSEIPGEGVLLKDKLNQSLRKASIVDGRSTEDEGDDTYYFLPYVTGAMSLYYNETVINNALGEGNWEEPKTSDELLALCKRLKDKGCSILLPGGLDQWASSLYLMWWAQYEGLDNYYKFYEGIGYDSTKNREAERSSLIFEQPGRLASMEASSDLLSYQNGYILSNSAEISVNNLNEYQTRFTLSKNNYAFYPCGDWLMQELKNNSTIESDSVIKMMKTPVISSIIESNDSYSADKSKRLPNITSDATLSAVIDYVDGNGELPTGVTEAEADIIREARNVVGSKAMEHIVYAPVFSNAKTLADSFLLFLASDEGIQIFKDHCIGGFAPYEYEYQNLDVTEQSVYEATKNAVYVGDFQYNILFYGAGVRALSNGSSDTLDGLLCRPKGMSAKEINDSFISAYSGVKWDAYLSKIASAQ